MIAPETFRTLEFDKILATVARFAHCAATREAISVIAPLPSREEMERRFGQVAEIRALLRQQIELPLAPFADLVPVLELLRPEGAVLNPADLLIFLPALRIMAGVGRQFAYRQDIPLLRELAGHVTGFPDLEEALSRSIGDDGEILDDASALLHDLRQRKRTLTARIRKRLEEIVRERQVAIFLQDDFITQRSGRWVIPVRMDSKGMVPGVVHDVSNTGETAFMEPIEIIGLANELENLAAEEKAEMIRILRELCAWLREDADEVERQFAALVELDRLNAIARFSELLGAEPPALNDAGHLALRSARHPLLVLFHLDRRGPAVVPLDLELGQSQRIMVITGPNTGGKTIAIKTAGLLTLMALSGLPVPAAADSTIPLLADVLVDIGDEQSIEASLSTFSAHVGKIAAILERAGKGAMVLLDELGTGTEPRQGAALACAVLDELLEQRAMVLATTHLTDIVGFVHRRDGMVNAAMEFDQQTLTPLYRLTSGTPGQSHALQVASRHGLPQRIIDRAQGMVGRLEAEFHALLAELEAQRQAGVERLAELARREAELAGRERLAAERVAAMEQRGREGLERALTEAREVVAKARREVNAILEEARRERSRAARAQLAAAEQELVARQRALHPEESLQLERLAEGDTVYVRSIGYDGTVTAIDRKGGRLRVRAGTMDLDVAMADLAPARGKAARPQAKGRRTEPAPTASRELNLIGLRVDDALAQLEPFLNHASLEGTAEVRIIHGRGTGALRRAIREALDGHSLVLACRAGEPLAGGDAVTVVTLR